MDKFYYMSSSGEIWNSDEEFYHHGIRGMKWGVRRYQNDNGTLTNAGKKHYKYREAALRSVNKGTNYVKGRKAVKIASIISSSAAVASGALWVASAFVPGMPILNTVAAAANLVSISVGPK
jgi:hypothetical protein